MLSSLTLTNVALVKKQQIDFSSGFNCLLGQSGAGKSVIIDALSFLLGAKADKNLIRSGETSMRVDGVFNDLSQPLQNALSELEIEFDDELILSRSLSLDGKASIRANGFPISAKMLQTLAVYLADFCGQHESVGLLQPANHLPILDQFAGEKAEQQKATVAQDYKKLADVRSQIAGLGGDEQQREREKDLLSYQINEIDSANLSVEEEKTLRERFDFISSSEKIFEKVSEAISKLDEGRENAVSLLYEAKSELSSLSDFKEIEGARDRLENAYYEIKDIVEVLEGVKAGTDFDASELEKIDERLELIKSLRKKYGQTVEDVLAFADEARDRLDEIENSEQKLKSLRDEEKVLEKRLLSDCELLSETRKAAATEFEQKICQELVDLEMKGTRFCVDFSRGECTSKGFDVVKFMFSANVGQEVRDLHKTASGGELSRLLLAFKNVMRSGELQTVIFDEIDAGISGHTAGKLAEKLKNIAKYTQIICITHTPVVASKADQFLLVEKEVVGQETVSHVSALTGEDVVRVVAGLIDGGEVVSETALSHAKKLLEEK